MSESYALGKFFSAGKRICLNRKPGPDGAPHPLHGTITFVDDSGTIYAELDDGSRATLKEGRDDFEPIRRIEVVYCPVGKEAEILEIDATPAAFRELVGGDFEEYMPCGDDIALVCNQDGVADRLPVNRSVSTGYGDILAVIRGDFFLVYAPSDIDEYLSMSKNRLQEYLNRFREPEHLRENADLLLKQYTGRTKQS